MSPTKPNCYNHPDRPFEVMCGYCGRLLCAECAVFESTSNCYRCANEYECLCHQQSPVQESSAPDGVPPPAYHHTPLRLLCVDVFSDITSLLEAYEIPSDPLETMVLAMLITTKAYMHTTGDGAVLDRFHSDMVQYVTDEYYVARDRGDGDIQELFTFVGDFYDLVQSRYREYGGTLSDELSQLGTPWTHAAALRLTLCPQPVSERTIGRARDPLSEKLAEAYAGCVWSFKYEGTSM